MKVLLSFTTGLLLSLSSMAQGQLDIILTKSIGGYFVYPSVNTDYAAFGYYPLFLNPGYQFTFNGINNTNAFEQNVTGNVSIYDPSNSLVINMPNGSTHPNLPPGGITHVGSTLPWLPTTTGRYKAVMELTSNNYGPGGLTPDRDSVYFYVTDSVYSCDFNRFTNVLGATELGIDQYKIANCFHTPVTMLATSAQVMLGPNTHVGGNLVLSLVDTNGYSLSGFPSTPVSQTSYEITAADTARGFAQIKLPGTYGGAVMDTSKSMAYYLIVQAITSNGTKPIEFLNDTTVLQPRLTSLFSLASQPNNWYFGFNNTIDVNAFGIRLHVHPFTIPPPPPPTAISEYSGLIPLSVYPNPARGKINVDLRAWRSSGTIEVLNTNGVMILNRHVEGQQIESIQVEGLAAGMYIIRYRTETSVSSAERIIVK